MAIFLVRLHFLHETVKELSARKLRVSAIALSPYTWLKRIAMHVPDTESSISVYSRIIDSPYRQFCRVASTLKHVLRNVELFFNSIIYVVEFHLYEVLYLNEILISVGAKRASAD